MAEGELTGGCACGAVRLVVRGQPVRVGLCHCFTCRKAHGSAFNPFVVYDRRQVAISGSLPTWRSSPEFEQSFCPVCGSRISGAYLDGNEIELSLGSFDEVGVVVPQYESWTCRREPWLSALETPQFDEDRL